MLTDEMLREATAEADRFLLSIVPEDDGEPHVFSKRFERKMQKLIRRVDHPIRYQVMRVAAAVALAIVTLFGAVMAVSPEARAAVVGWVKSAFHEFFEYSNEVPNTNKAPTDENNDANNPTNEPVKYEYCLSVIPEGYRELQVADRADGRTYLYVNDSSTMLKFAYTHGAKMESLFIKAEDYERYSGFVNEHPADIYIAIKENETSVIVWQDFQANVLFWIHSDADQEELTKIAENIVKTEAQN